LKELINLHRLYQSSRFVDVMETQLENENNAVGTAVSTPLSIQIIIDNIF